MRPTRRCDMPQTIQDTIRQLHGSLRDYIEATYHIGSPALIAQRRSLLARTGVIHQRPYVESTPRYQAGPKFAEIPDLPSAALSIFESLAASADNLTPVLYDPPY